MICMTESSIFTYIKTAWQIVEDPTIEAPILVRLLYSIIQLLFNYL